MATVSNETNTVIPTLVLNDATNGIELYKKAFGATEVYRMNVPDTGKVLHACLQIGNSKVFVCDTSPQCMTATQSNFYVSFPDVDTAFKQAKNAGMQEMMAVDDMFWGDRMGNVKDPFGNSWSLATHVRDVPQQEMEEAVQKMASKAA